MARTRVYDFELPFTASGVVLWFAVNKFKSSPYWSKLPEDMRQKVEHANNSWGGQLVITKHDLDRIDPKTWEGMAKDFDLKYHYQG